MSTISGVTNERRPGRAGQRVSGLLLLLPIALCWLGTLVVPTIQTIIMSFQDIRLIGEEARFVGMANYDRLFESGPFGQITGFTVSLVMVRLLAIAILPLLLALAVNVFSRSVRIPIRLLFTIPLALFAPVAAAIAWRLALSPQFGLFGSLEVADRSWFANPRTAPGGLWLIDGLTSFAIACGLGLVIYGAAMRGPGNSAPDWPNIMRPLLVSWVVILLTSIALSVQSFSLPYLVTNGGPGSSTTTLALQQFRDGFMQFRFGSGSAVATILLVGLAILGILAGLLIILNQMQIEHVPANKPALQVSVQSKPIAAILLLVLLFGCLIVSAIAGWPLLWTALNSLKSNAEIVEGQAGLFPLTPSLDAYRELDQSLGSSIASINTILPPFLALLIQLPLAYLGALGIGGLRPFGTKSEWLLLPFCPWLFVGVGPLSFAAFQARASAGVLDSLPGLVPPILCSVPMLVILTLFFKGQSTRRATTGAGIFNGLILPSLPLVALLACIAFLIEAQQIDWPLLIVQSQELMPSNLFLLQYAMRGSDISLLSAAVVQFGLALFLPFFLIFALFQLFYVDRLAITAAARE